MLQKVYWDLKLENRSEVKHTQTHTHTHRNKSSFYIVQFCRSIHLQSGWYLNADDTL